MGKTVAKKGRVGDNTELGRKRRLGTPEIPFRYCFPGSNLFL